MNNKPYSIVIKKEKINIDYEIKSLRFNKLGEINKKIGAVATFIGSVRDINANQQVYSMFLEHYPEMTEKSIEKILKKAYSKWKIFNIRVVHRIGLLNAGENIVFVGVASGHRKEAFDCCHFVMDYLKTQAPFWKKESTNLGERWVKARSDDDLALEKWKD